MFVMRNCLQQKLAKVHSLKCKEKSMSNFSHSYHLFFMHVHLFVALNKVKTHMKKFLAELLTKLDIQNHKSMYVDDLYGEIVQRDFKRSRSILLFIFRHSLLSPSFVEAIVDGIICNRHHACSVLSIDMLIIK